MFVTSKKRLVPANINTIVLQGNDGAYYYMHRDLYDQLVVLTDTYGYDNRINILVSQLTDNKTIEELPASVQNFYNTVPEPIKVAAPFLCYVTDVAELENFEDQCGALSVMSMSINLRMIVKVDRSLRAALKFSLHVREEYRPTWDRFFQENPEFGTQVSMPAPLPTTTQIETPTGMVVTDDETGEEEEIQFTSNPMDFDFSSMMGDLVAMGSSTTAASPSSGSSYDTGDADEYDDDEENKTAGGGSGFSMLEGV